MLLANKKIINRFLIFSSILFILLPAAQVSGPFLTDMFIVFIGLIYLMMVLIYNKKIHKNYLVLTFFLIFWIFICFTSLISEFRGLAIKPSFTFIRFILFTYCVIYLLKNYSYILKYLNITLIAVLILLLLDGYTQFFFLKSLFGFEKIRPDRLSSLFGDELVLGSYLTNLFPIMLYLFYENIKDKRMRYVNIVIIFLIPPLILLSGERAAFFMCILFLLFVVPFLISPKLIILLFVSTSLIFLILSFNKTIYDRYVVQTKDHLFLVANERPLILPNHIGLFNSAIFIFDQNKLIGSGIKSFRKLCDQNNTNFKKEITKKKINISFCSTHPHNYYLQLLSELGFIGIFFLLSLFFYLFLSYIRQLILLILGKKVLNTNLKKYLILLSGTIIQIWPLTTTGNLFNNWNSSFIFFQLSIFLYYKYEQYNQNQK